jgi:predicted metal-dependent enzyme (double-stranded beta helix superfamily)
MPLPSSSPTACTSIERLCVALDFACDAHANAPDTAAFARQVRAALAEASADPALLTPAHREGDAATYRRHLLAADPCGRYAVAALVWAPGQASPVHGHHTWCGYAVIEGALTETLYRWDPHDNRAIETRRHVRDAGAVSFVGAGRGGIHRLGNAAAPDRTRHAVSLHVYGVEAARIGTHVNDLVALGV